jgi:NAD(P)H dehydrogenase (quinone)
LAKIAIIYYSGTGNTHRLALAAEEGAKSAGAEVRLRRAAELASDAAIDKNPAWRAHVEATRDIPVAELQDLEWADGFLFGSPSRFGLPAAQLKQFIDVTGPLWQAGKLQDKPVSVFGGAITPHGGQESTLLALQNVFYHWGAVIVPIGYTDPIQFVAGGNPYGVSLTDTRGGPVPEDILTAARYLGRRIVKFADVLSKNLNGVADAKPQRAAASK